VPNFDHPKFANNNRKTSPPSSVLAIADFATQVGCFFGDDSFSDATPDKREGAEKRCWRDLREVRGWRDAEKK